MKFLGKNREMLTESMYLSARYKRAEQLVITEKEFINKEHSCNHQNYKNV